jgi:hypothetical protein
MQTLWQDLRFGARMLLKQPGFTLIAGLTLALGSGANTAAFSLLHTVLIQPLPYRDAGRVLFAMGWNVQRDELRFRVAAADFEDRRAPCSSFEQAAGYRYWSVNLMGQGEPERLPGYHVTANLFQLLGVEPLLGRTFQPDEDKPGAAKVAVLSQGLWQRRFGVVNDVRHLDPATPPRPESYLPLEQAPLPALTLTARTSGAPEAMMTAVRERLRALDANLPLYNVPAMEQIVARSLFTPRLTTNVMLMFGGVALLMATIGLFGLISYAVSQRTHELGIRLALGATTRDVLRGCDRRFGHPSQRKGKCRKGK